MPGRVVLQALNMAVEKLPASAGVFPQVSGLRMVVDPSAAPGDRVRDVRVSGQPLSMDRAYTVGIPDFIFRGGDGYTMFAAQQVLVGPEAGTLISAAIEKHLAATRDVTQQIDGRITIR